jgi:hypothetical protein
MSRCNAFLATTGESGPEILELIGIGDAAEVGDDAVGGHPVALAPDTFDQLGVLIGFAVAGD